MEKSALREILSQSAKMLYARALDRTGDEESAKEILKEIVRYSTAAGETDTITQEYLTELCDRLCEQRLAPVPDPIETIQKAASDLHTEPASEDTLESLEPTKTEPPASFSSEAGDEPEALNEPKGHPVDLRRVQRTMPTEPDLAPAAYQPVTEAQIETQEPAADTDSEEDDSYSLEEDDWINELREQRRRTKTEPREQGRSGHLYNIAIIICIPIILALVWVIAGLLMRSGVLAFSDLGYTWFNENVTNLF